MFEAAAVHNWIPSTPNSYPLGLGHCVDDKDDTMPFCSILSVTESFCRNQLTTLSNSIGYDYEADCFHPTFCRLFSIDANENTCGLLTKKYHNSTYLQWKYTEGIGTTITKTSSIKSDAYDKTVCVLKS